MSRFTVAFAALALAAAPLAQASSDAVDRVCIRDTEAAPRAAGVRAQLTAMFAVQLQEEEDPNSLSAPGSFELIVARLDADGKPVMVCVDSEAAARRFLDAPLAKIQTKKAQEK